MHMLVVMVRYVIPLQESQTIRSLEHILQSDPSLLNAFEFLIWDNSPHEAEDKTLPFPFIYQHSEKNRGVAGAYNEALKIAASSGHPWMLLLDQDTILPALFLQTMLKYSRQLDGEYSIAAIAPSVWVNGQMMFPRRVRFNRTVAGSPSLMGVHEGEWTTANSGIAMRVSALQEVGGYSESFRLEFSDMYVFHRLHRIEKKLWIAGDIRLDHQLAITDYGGAMTPERYRNFAAAEDAFVNLCQSRMENVAQTARLLIRTLRQLHGYSDKRFARISFEYFLRRLTDSWVSRIRAWTSSLLP